MDNEVITIYSEDVEIAQNICSSITDSNIRGRAVANVLSVKLAERFFNSINIQTDTKSGLHNISNVIENLDIADIYLNGAYIDVRVYFSDDELCVPKFHFDLDVNPAAYMFIQLKSDLSGYVISGFMRPEHINKDNLKDDYYYIDKRDLISYYDIESKLTDVLDTFDGSKEMLYSFVDGTIEENDAAKLLRVLVSSARARNTLIKAFKAKTLFKYVSTVPQAVVNNDKNHVEIQDFLESKENEPNDNMSIPEEEEVLDSDSLYNALEYSTEVTPNTVIDDDLAFGESAEKEDASNTDEEQIDSLFTGEQEGVPVVNKKSSSPIMSIILLLVLVSAGLFFAYTKFAAPNNNDVLPEDSLPAATSKNIETVPAKAKEVAMPNETVTTPSNEKPVTEEASPVAIPAIEQHLDSSVLVSNLKVDWEVPAGYASNTTAKRYLIKLGKVIQLNLKSELLLLTKPPISNRITVELKYNAGKGKFEIVGINDSSGEKSVDEVILSTIKTALEMSISSNIESFGKLQGNPVLIIHL